MPDQQQRMPAGAVVESRRDRQRRELRTEILAIARSQLDAGGIEAVSWRAIAREVGMNAASLYTYFDNIDALVATLLSDGRRALAAAVMGAEWANAGAPGQARAIACALAYRSWALANPAPYRAVFATPVPADHPGPSIDEVFVPFARAVADAADHRFDTDDFTTIPPTDLPAFAGLQAMLHGFVSLEINGHLTHVGDGGAVLVGRLNETFNALTDSSH